MLRAKSAARLFAVSDSTALAGQPPGRYRTAVGGEVDVSAEGRLSYVGTELLAGAGRDLADGLRHLVERVGVSWRDALRLTVGTPARVVAEQAGKRAAPPALLTPGARADLLLLTSSGAQRGRVERVVVDGERL